MELDYTRTVDRLLVHRDALGEVFLTDLQPLDDENYAAAGQLPARTPTTATTCSARPTTTRCSSWRRAGRPPSPAPTGSSASRPTTSSSSPT
ncbi:hypothetical protein O1L60_00100 [Streptomyces diastatochromogenes]|nr:hypothetical protein [Streptomyces diastatochromogenes]